MALKNLLALVVLLGVVGVSFGGDLYEGYYRYNNCPQMEYIVRDVTYHYIYKDPTLAAALLRMHFHDCFVRIKGPWWPVPLGRRDGRVSNISEANLPSPFANVTTLKKNFADKGLNTKDLVVLSGAHTIGVSSCGLISRRIYNFTGKGDSDPALNPEYVVELKKRCQPTDVTTSVDMDPTDVNAVSEKKGLFISDSTLLDDWETNLYIQKQVLLNGFYFNKDFSDSMVKLGFVGVLTGDQGEIRNQCDRVN